MVRKSISVIAVSLLLFSRVSHGQVTSLSEHIETLGLPSASVGEVVAHYSVGSEERGKQLARLAADVAAFYERELEISFNFGLAVLSPDDWWQPYGADMPYGIPWFEESTIVVPASLQEGVLIGPYEIENRHMVDFTLLHEFGHLASKAYFHPDGEHDEIPIPWFDELVATYFAYRFVVATDSALAESSRERSRRGVVSFTPAAFSLDWSYMRSLPGPEISANYGWYQYLLNLRAIELHEAHGADLLPALKARLTFDSMGEWATESLLEQLERVAPGFQKWVTDLESGDIVRRYE